MLLELTFTHESVGSYSHSEQLYGPPTVSLSSVECSVESR